MLVTVKTWNVLEVTRFLLDLKIKFSVEGYTAEGTALKLPADIHQHHLDGVHYRNSDDAWYDKMAASANVQTPW